MILLNGKEFEIPKDVKDACKEAYPRFFDKSNPQPIQLYIPKSRMKMTAQRNIEGKNYAGRLAIHPRGGEVSPAYEYRETDADGNIKPEGVSGELRYVEKINRASNGDVIGYSPVGIQLQYDHVLRPRRDDELFFFLFMGHPEIGENLCPKGFRKTVFVEFKNKVQEARQSLDSKRMIAKQSALILDDDQGYSEDEILQYCQALDFPTDGLEIDEVRDALDNRIKSDPKFFGEFVTLSKDKNIFNLRLRLQSATRGDNPSVYFDRAERFWRYSHNDEKICAIAKQYAGKEFEALVAYAKANPKVLSSIGTITKDTEQIEKGKEIQSMTVVDMDGKTILDFKMDDSDALFATLINRPVKEVVEFFKPGKAKWAKELEDRVILALGS